MTASVKDFHSALTQVAREFGDGSEIAEAELVNRWFMGGVFSTLGYGTDRDDYRVERRIPGAGRADVVLRAFGQRARALLEFKRPGTALDDHVGQVREYANKILPDVAVLTNGRELWLFTRSGPLPMDPLVPEPAYYDLATLAVSHAAVLFERLRKLEVDVADLRALEAALDDISGRPVRVEGPTSPGGAAFLERFSLDRRSVFGRLVLALFEALPALEKDSEFTAGAYGFWQRAYARELSSEQAPETWKPLLGDHRSTKDLRRFMFSLESAYAILARALLAKAMQDSGFPNMDVTAAYRRTAQNHQSHGVLTPSAHPVIVAEVFEFASRQAFATLFASDIFDWWQDAERLPDPRPLAEALTETILGVLSFNFAGLEGDVLGELYQAYFDPETRLALGEFYTPPEVVEFILDQVGYIGEATDRGRLLDPACGSGTFLVAALRRYLAAHQNQDPSTVLSRLVGGLHIVGLDVNPFATLLAQVNYAAQLLPTYARAIRQGHFAIHSLPVYRTDSLRFERREAETEEFGLSLAGSRGRRRAPPRASFGFRFTYAADMAVIRDRLPVRAANGFVEVSLPMPRADLAREGRFVDNVEEYALALHALFDAIDAGDDEPQLARRLERLGLPNASELAEFMAAALAGVRQTIAKLRDEYGDGRFRKTLRDLAVAVVVKNEIKYDFVVGNPPYVRVQRLPNELKAYWTDKYAWAQGNFDIYIPFIERAITDWLRDGGRLGFICSNRFLLANYAAELRANLPNIATPEIILDLRDTRVFQGALNYPAIFVFRRGTSADASFLAGRAFADPAEGPDALLRDAVETLGAARATNTHHRGQFCDAFPMPVAELTGQGWHIMPRAERRVLDALEDAGTHRLGELTVTQSGGFQGVSTGADDVMVLRLLEDRGDRLLLLPKGDDAEPAEIERDAVRPWLFGHDVERWYIDWDGWYVLFPYLKVDGMYKLAPTREFTERFAYAGQVPFAEDIWPGFWNYVRRPSVRRMLEARENGKFRRGQPSAHLWHGPSYPRSIDLYGQPKLVVQISSTRADIAVDLSPHVFQGGGRGGGVYGLLFSEGLSNRLPYICAVLNSRPLDFLLKHVSTVYEGKAYSYSDAFLKDMPIVLPTGSGENDITRRLSSLANSLSENKRTLRDIERSCANFPVPQAAAIPPTIDRYPLERLAEGHITLRVLDRRKLTWAELLDGRPALRAGRATVSLPTAAHADVVRAWLGTQHRELVQSAELLAIRLPETEAGCRLLLNELARQKERIGELEQYIEVAEHELDELVLELYGLDRDADARAVIEDFLARF
ncbi:MAG: Eco57I restriction-modification methylase domain-containing protein [Dehalococcoidia bacterium]